MAPAKPPAGKPTEPPAGPEVTRRRPQDPNTRRQDIVKAALDVFSEQGFAAARLDDVAARAGIAKGTLYLYFEHKEALFEELIRSAADPVLGQATALVGAEVPFAELIARFYALIRTEVLGTDRRLVLRLILTEGRRFPRIAEFYHREVISRGLGLIKAAAAGAVTRGETRYAPLVRFPHLIMAPALLAVTWEGLFSTYEPLDVAGLLDASLAMLTDQTGRTS